MALEPDKLLVLKAFYMGRAIATRPRRKSDALRMIDAAISQLENRNDSRSQVRLLFYLLLKSEALRGDGDIVDLRKHAKTIAEKIGGHTYEYFMALEEATQTRKRVYGVERGIIADFGSALTLPVSRSGNPKRHRLSFSMWASVSCAVGFSLAGRACGLAKPQYHRTGPRPNHTLQPTPWIAVVFPSALARRG